MFIRKEITSSLVLLLFGVGFLLYDLKYPLDQWANPGPAVFPLMVGTVLAILAAWQLVQEARKPKNQGSKENDEGARKSTHSTPRSEARGILRVDTERRFLPRFKHRGLAPSNVSITEFLQRSTGETKPLVLVAVFIVYLLMVKWVGFFISNFLFVIVSSKLLGAKDWARPIVLSAGVSLFCYFLFEVWLKLSFPRGILF